MINNFHIPINDILSFTISDIETLIIKNEKYKRNKMKNINGMSDKVMLNIDINDML